MNWMRQRDVEQTFSFEDKYGHRITINANRVKWEIQWADYSTDSRENAVSDAKSNISAALRHLASLGFFDGDPDEAANRSGRP